MKIDSFWKEEIVVVFDTEYTTWEGAMERSWSGENEHRELVQIAAQKINLQTAEVVDSFERFVIPRINCDLSDYFTELTHIMQQDIEEKGIDFRVMLDDFLAWTKDVPILSYSRLGGGADEVVLQENIDLYDLDITLPNKRLGNMVEIFNDGGIDTSGYNSGKLYQAFDLDLGGHQHNAMHDVDSLVQSLFALKRRLKL